MEHRRGIRTPLNLEAVIHPGRRRAMPARVRDISIGGMRVHSDATLSVHQPVTVEFTFPGDHRPRRWRGAVVHVTDGGAGLMFGSLRPGELAVLHRLL